MFAALLNTALKLTPTSCHTLAALLSAASAASKARSFKLYCDAGRASINTVAFKLALAGCGASVGTQKLGCLDNATSGAVFMVSAKRAPAFRLSSRHGLKLGELGGGVKALNQLLALRADATSGRALSKRVSSRAPAGLRLLAIRSKTVG